VGFCWRLVTCFLRLEACFWRSAVSCWTPAACCCRLEACFCRAEGIDESGGRCKCCDGLLAGLGGVEAELEPSGLGTSDAIVLFLEIDQPLV
jgi:hypothetical protein